MLDSVFASGSPWLRGDLEAVRAGKSGRKIIAYLSIGEAEDYRPYWKWEWGGHGKLTGKAPAWLGKVNPDWPGNYRVYYWNPEWQKIVLETVDRVMKDGFDGIYLDIVDGFEIYEQDGADFIDDRINPETKQSYRRDMVDWVKIIMTRARDANPSALVIPQNGSQLLVYRDFVDAVSAIGIEDLFTVGNRLQPAADSKYRIGFLKKIQKAGKPVLLIEYPRKRERKDVAVKRARDNGYLWLVTDRNLTTLGKSGR